ncbi:S8 family serine peptidase [Nocardioides massiliensis]|uniref:Serine protease n=1 Tax=Nocardioides massiliensis TaxID=1325935 RepID=A0ABT9NP10_9ACTN|nr:S8 family serine peptidase [Nocardioides massiliensis]MDP9822141.1 hypothetical protein [Nocardioides massiliensis]
MRALRRLSTALLAGGLAASLTVAGAVGAATSSSAAPLAEVGDPTAATGGAVYLVTVQKGAQDRVLASLDVDPLYRYTHTIAGFSARLEPADVKALRARADVVRVERSTRQRLQSGSTTDFLELAGDTGAWQSLGGPERAGAGVVIGSVDSGLWPRTPAFAPLTDVDARPAGFTGACRTGVAGSNFCTTKVVAADWFVEAFGPDAIASNEELSPRDTVGHGTHSASVAAGGAGVDARLNGRPFGQVSGIAPAARLAVYKACWAAPDPDQDGCETADLVAAVDRAVGDGVDVLDVPVSSTPAAPFDTLSAALRHAERQGVFVATAAGNAGPGPGTVQQPAPWVTTAAASTHTLRQGAVVLGDGTRLVGAMVARTPVESTRLVAARTAAARGSSTHDAALCHRGSLDPAAVKDAIVVCQRGVIARVEKSAAVRDAGAAGMVLTNPYPQELPTDVHSVPSVHLDTAAARELQRYLDRESAATAALDPAATDSTPVPQVLAASGRGPADVDGDLLKPDVTAPGSGVLAAASPLNGDGQQWAMRTGTSVSSAHVAGLAALLRSARPGWSPAQVKSALMTTAYDVEGPSSPLTQGAGHVDLARALDPGLTFDVSARAFARYAAGRLPARRLNLPSVAVDDLLDTALIRRRLTNVSGRTESYSVNAPDLPGVQVTARPASFTLAPGETQTVRIRLTRTANATPGVVTTGQLTWVGQTDHVVRVPVAVRPAVAASPAVVRAPLTAGRVTVPVLLGASAVPVQVAGLVGAFPTPFSLVEADGDRDTLGDGDTVEMPLAVPAGTRWLRVAVETNNPRDDVDLTLLRGDDVVAEASGLDARETLTLRAPRPGDYRLVVHGARAGNTSTVTGRVYTWTLSDRDAGNLTPATRTVTGTSGDRTRLGLTWPQLDGTQRWLGVVGLGEGVETMVELS